VLIDVSYGRFHRPITTISLHNEVGTIGRWENVFFASGRESVGYLHGLRGKSKKAKRTLMLLERVAEVLRRQKEAGVPAEGWVFPGNEEDGSLS
jgi:hypothetical protein